MDWSTMLIDVYFSQVKNKPWLPWVYSLTRHRCEQYQPPKSYTTSKCDINLDDNNCKNWLIFKVLQCPQGMERRRKDMKGLRFLLCTLYTGTMYMMISMLCFPMFELCFFRCKKKYTCLLTRHQFLSYALMDSAIKLLSNTLTKLCTVHLYSMLFLFSAIVSANIISIDGPRTT